METTKRFKINNTLYDGDYLTVTVDLGNVSECSLCKTQLHAVVTKGRPVKLICSKCAKKPPPKVTLVIPNQPEIEMTFENYWTYGDLLNVERIKKLISDHVAVDSETNEPVKLDTMLFYGLRIVFYPKDAKIPTKTKRRQGDPLFCNATEQMWGDGRMHDMLIKLALYYYQDIRKKVTKKFTVEDVWVVSEKLVVCSDSTTEVDPKKAIVLFIESLVKDIRLEKMSCYNDIILLQKDVDKAVK